MIERETLSYRPTAVSAPGETLSDLLEERSMTQADLAARTGRPLKTINEIIKGKSAITPETAIQLERVLGTPAEFWNQREANYRASLARKKEEADLSGSKGWVGQFPIREMVSRGWIADRGNNPTAQAISVLNFFGVASPEQWDAGWTHRHLAFRKAMNLGTDLGATAAWLRQGEILGEKANCAPYSKELLISSLDKIKQLTSEKDPKTFAPKLQALCAQCGVAVVFVKPFKNVPVFGATCWLNPEKALIQLSNRGKFADIFWFTLFHELGHVLYHSKKEIFVEIDKKSGTKSAEEIEADEFASEKLIPRKALERWLSMNPNLTDKAVLQFSSEMGVAPGIVVGRLCFIKKIDFGSPLRSHRFQYELE